MKTFRLIVVFILYAILIFAASFIKSTFSTDRNVTGGWLLLSIILLCTLIIVLVVAMHRLLKDMYIIVFDVMAILSVLALIIAG